ncbi:unnamed protein product [Mytilus coruscus]|uniref:Uncharacterized protein n=1 Tax=Mytilus coruscus TaxID=42192 RepID=A0A6J8F174_MYTCO|nr:unnamed protein product [Mytilus coruscus]
MTVLSKGELHFLTRQPVENIMGRPLQNVLISSIHVDKYQRKKPKVDVKEKRQEIENNIICIKNEPSKGSPMVNECFLKILNILKILPDKAFTEVAEFYFLKLNRKLNENRQSTIIMLDAFGTLTTNLSQEIIGRMIFQSPNPDPDLIVQYMVHVVSSDSPPNTIILNTMEDICFHPEKYAVSFYAGNLYNRVMLALGTAARKLYSSGEHDKAKEITSKVNNLLGIHAQAILKAAMYDDNEEVRYEAKLLYQAHPNSEYKHYNRFSVVEVADNKSVVPGDQSFGPHNRQKRSFFKDLDFKLAAPSVDWRDELGS